MKKLIPLAISAALLFSACAELSKAAKDLDKQLGTTTAGGLSSAEIINGLKEALTVGANKSASAASQQDGFFKNARLFIPFPPAAVKAKEWALKFGLKNQVDKFEETLNRAAEESSKKAAPIFVNAIKAMTIGDGLNILRGTDTAATSYLRTKTTGDLTTTFRPVVHDATEKVQLTKYWTPIANGYNKVPGVTPVNPDLDGYVTDRAIRGLFLLIGDEEAKIRKDPVARTSELLKKVFGSKENPHNK
ncbi:MAG: DUF4197 domain-containing protein [Bacteroidia bacterium]